VDYARRAGLILLCATGFAQQLRFDSQAGVVEMRGSEPSRGTLHVYLGNASTPTLGELRVDGDTLRFTPRFPFLAGREHRVELAGAVALRFTPPAEPSHPPTRVVSVYPSSKLVPANLLRMYVMFSQPMMPEDFGDNIRLLDSSGEEIPHTFLHVEGGLWSPDSTRLTLLLEPGRIKSKLAMHDKFGLALRPGERFSVVVSNNMRDAFGASLASEYAWDFAVEAEDRTSPEVSRWIINSPRPGTFDPLTVDAGKPLDEFLFHRTVRVATSDHQIIDGVITIEDGGRKWRLIPSRPWAAGDYVLRVDADLEDLAGNRPTRLFEEHTNPDGRRAESQTVKRFFRLETPRNHRETTARTP
jgi:hypothetical protein